MSKENKYCVITGKVKRSFFNSDGSSFKVELLSEKPIDFLKDAYSDVKSDRFIPEILTKEDANTISFHSKFRIDTILVKSNGVKYELDEKTIGEGSKVRVKLKGTGRGVYPVAIIVEELVEKEPYNPFDF